MPRWKKQVCTALFAVLAGLYIWKKRSVCLSIFTVFVYAGALTLLLSPLCRRLEKRGLSAKKAAACAMGGFVLAALLILSAFVPYLAAKTMMLFKRMTPTLAELLRRGSAWLGIQVLEQKGLAELLASGMSRATSLLARGGAAFAMQTGQALFALVLAYYMLCERRKLAGYLLLLLPTGRRAAFLFAVQGCKNAALGYLSGVIKTSLFVALATFAGLFLIGVQDALLLAVFMGFFEILPYIGPLLAAVPILLTALGQGPLKALLALVVVVLVQQVEGNFVSPYFTAVSTSIHPLTAIVSVFVLGSLFGLWGILLAVPAVVTARSLLWSINGAENITNQ